MVWIETGFLSSEGSRSAASESEWGGVPGGVGSGRDAGLG